MPNEIETKNPLVLAFVGDAYWTLYIRERISVNSFDKVGKLHLKANNFVSAIAQAGFFEKIQPFLTEQEIAIAGRARNADNNTRPKNCSLAKYKLATAFEAIVGYNYLVGNQKRLENLFDIIM